ncbi:MAG: Mrp/NBP35 family ATP-binding protein [Hyphomicrobiales bacterium]
MMTVSKEQIYRQLAKIAGPDGKSDLISLGLVSEIVIRDGVVAFALNIDKERAAELEPMREAAEHAVGQMEGVNRVNVVLTAHRPGGSAKPRRAGRSAIDVPGVERTIAVASGKGGVGKSTVAVNLALGLAKLGLKVGILDADIYGPSMPRLLGLGDTPMPESRERVLTPPMVFGVKAMSMGFLVGEETPVIWRGPMVISALDRMLRSVAWGRLDVLVVDMPPGTGDAQLTMAQKVKLAGAVIVSTPQDLALVDARRGLNMFRRVDVPVLGLVENMSYFLCPHCGARSEIFGHGGARGEAGRLGVEFLGEVPLDRLLRERSDQGRPIIVSDPDSPHARIFRDMAAQLWAGLEADNHDNARPFPEIVVE